MKRFFHFMTVIALAALTLTGCDDVPMPYNQPNIKPNEPSGTSSLPYSDSNLKDWTVSTVTGADWSLGSTYAKATGYNGGTTTATETWLVSPTINTTTSDGAVINFDHVIRYVKSATDINNHEMYISSDYTGDVKTATWTKLDYKPVESATQTWDFYAADPIQIPDAYLNKDVVIAFKFTCNDQNSTTWEIKNFSVKEGKAETGGGDTPTPGEKGSSKDNPLSTTEAVDIINSGNIPTTEVYVKGIISSVDYYNSKYKSISYYLSDDGKSKVLDVYSGKGLNGADFADKSDLQVGQAVIVKGKLELFTDKKGNKIPEISQSSQIVSIEGSGSTPETPETPGTSEGITISGTTVTLTNKAYTAGTTTATLDLSTLSFSNGEAVTTITLSDGSTVTFDANGETNGPKYYTATKGVRVYKNNTVTIEGKANIASIVFECDIYQGKEQVGNNTATISFSGKKAVYTNVFKEATGGGVQLRIKKITVIYAK